MQRRADNSVRGRIARARARLRGGSGRRPGGRRPRSGGCHAGKSRHAVSAWSAGAWPRRVCSPSWSSPGDSSTSTPSSQTRPWPQLDQGAFSRRDYWKSRAIGLYEQALQYQQFAQFVGADKQGQYLSLAQQSIAQLPAVWGSTDVDPASLEKMIDDQIYLQGMKDLGLGMTKDEIRTFALNRFAQPGSPLILPSPSRHWPPRGGDSDQHRWSLFATPLASPVAATPVSGTPVIGTAVRSVPVTGTPKIASPISGDTRRHASGHRSHTAATPNPGEARATAEAGFAKFADQVFP